MINFTEVHEALKKSKISKVRLVADLFDINLKQKKQDLIDCIINELDLVYRLGYDSSNEMNAEVMELLK